MTEIEWIKGVHKALDMHDAPPIVEGLCLAFPMRADYEAQVIVPRNMTHAEAKRLCAFVMSIPVDGGGVE